MKTKKQYIAPATEVVDMEVHLMTQVSMEGNNNTNTPLDWDDNASGTNASEGW